MLDITDRDIADLDDSDLRALVARLSEAVLRHRELPTSAVTWGGRQDAADGGLDVRVSLHPSTTIEGFVPRPATGFQVKKSAIAPAAIESEMRPGGRLRGVIEGLADLGGAYIIVSAGSSVSDSALAHRREAMARAVADYPNANQLTLDFYDRQRLATWVRDYPGLVPWVRARAGRPMQGWQSYGDWSFAGDGPAGAFITDATVRVHDPHAAKDKVAEAREPAVAGIEQIRKALSCSGRSIRLVGLSGVGKTRLVQALFDSQIGMHALDPARAIYADLAHHPDPVPIAVATSLLQRRAPSILVIDNCPPDLHRELTRLCRMPGSMVSVITVEYDIRDDQPEGTEVFRLEAASSEVVAKIVAVRCPPVSRVDADTIGVFSGGNARIGLALAHTVQQGDSLSGLSDEDLFLRLFKQRHEASTALLTSGEACALVYSFDGEFDGKTFAGDGAELSCLAALAGCRPETLHRHIAELKRRGLVQERGRWRAVMPHAIANRLAKRALENLAWTQVQEQLVQTAPERLFQSFTRRLGYLHGAPAAVRIAEDWLSSSGMLGNVTNLSQLAMTVLRNIAPLSPSALLAAIERAGQTLGASGFFSTANAQRAELARLLRKIAYDPALFERCAELLVRFAEAEGRDCRHESVANMLWSLFFPFLSGTHATAEQRARVIDRLLRSDSERRSGLGVKALEAMLETSHFSSSYDFDFGSAFT